MLPSQCRGPSVSTSIRYVKGSSEPIPINPITPEPEDPDTDNISSHYELATWRMFTLIITARRLRVISRSGYYVEPERHIFMIDQDYLAIAHGQVQHPVEVDVPSCAHQTRPTTTKEEDCGVFVFDEA